MKLSPRTLVVAFGQDFSLFVAWSVIPVWAKTEVHASPGELGFLPVVGGGAYVLMSLAGGRLSDRVSRTTLARIGLGIFAAFCLLAWQAEGIRWIYAVTALGGVGNALIWPGLQALVGDESGPDDLDRNLGRFSLAWSAGKTLGFFLGGLAWAEFRMGSLLGCAILSALLVPLVPSRPAGHRAGDAALVADGGPSPQVRSGYLRAAWLANFAAYGLGATLNFLYEERVHALGRPEAQYFIVLGTVFLAQTAAFWWFGRFSGWRYRPGSFFFWQAAGAAALVVIGAGVALPVACAAALVAGTGLGLSYSASIYYSVHSNESRGARAGIHEAVIGASNFAIPLAGGVLQQASGWAPAGYALSAGLVAAMLVAQFFVLRRATGARPR